MRDHVPGARAEAGGPAFGTTLRHGHPVPICGIAGDRRAAWAGLAGFAPGEAKLTYGTGSHPAPDILIEGGEISHRLRPRTLVERGLVAAATRKMP